MLKRLRDYPVQAAGPLISQMAYTAARTQLASEFSARTPTWAGAAPELMKIVDKVRPARTLAVPLLAGEDPLGVLVLGRGEHRPRFAATDVAVVEELARSLAAGLANVETFAREHTVAETLQHALLPDVPPPIERLDLAVRYLPVSDGVHVGGDWYDIFPIGHQRVGLAIGDVAGHSIGSAAIMGHVRGCRMAALSTTPPPDVLRRTNTAICQMLPDALASVRYGVRDAATGDLLCQRRPPAPADHQQPRPRRILDAAPAEAPKPICVFMSAMRQTSSSSV